VKQSPCSFAGGDPGCCAFASGPANIIQRKGTRLPTSPALRFRPRRLEPFLPVMIPRTSAAARASSRRWISPGRRTRRPTEIWPRRRQIVLCQAPPGSVTVHAMSYIPGDLPPRPDLP
jgi:hypothetical protein